MATLPSVEFDEETISGVYDRRYPYLYSRGREVDEALLQEVFVCLRTTGVDYDLARIPDGFVEKLEVPWLMSITSIEIQLKAGMLFADGFFLFDSLPFVNARTKDVKCKLDVPDSGKDDLSSGAKMSARTVTEKRLTTMILGEKAKAVFRLTEFECCCSYFVVQVFQLILEDRLEPAGKYFVRAFYPLRPSLRAVSKKVASSGLASPLRGERTSEDDPADYFEDPEDIRGALSPAVNGEIWGARTAPKTAYKALRRALPAEERLRVLRPWFYDWCLERDPTELGAEINIIKQSLLYYKHNFTLRRLTHLIVNSCRTIQRWIRSRQSAKHGSLMVMVATWELLERGVKEKLLQFRPDPKDPIAVTVNEVLSKHVITTAEHKFRVIEDLRRERKVLYLAATPEQRVRERDRFSWNINPHVLFQTAQKQALDKLMGGGPDSLFSAPGIQEELRRMYKELADVHAKTWRSSSTRLTTSRRSTRQSDRSSRQKSSKKW